MRSRPFVLAIMAVLATALTAHAQVPPSEQPDRTELDPFAQPLFLAGAVTFLTSYGLSFGVAATTLDRDNRGLYVPIAGPWLALSASRPCDGDCETADDVLLVLDGVAQAAGVAMMAKSLIGDRARRAPARGARLLVTSRTVGITARF